MGEGTMDTAIFEHGDAKVPAAGPGCDAQVLPTSEIVEPREGCATVTLNLSPIVVDALLAQAEQEHQSLSHVVERLLRECLMGDVFHPCRSSEVQGGSSTPASAEPS